jgi:hypothetical protein
LRACIASSRFPGILITASISFTGSMTFGKVDRN